VVRGDPRPATFYLSGPTVPGTGALLFMAERAAFRRPGGGLSFRGGGSPRVRRPPARG